MEMIMINYLQPVPVLIIFCYQIIKTKMC